MSPVVDLPLVDLRPLRVGSGDLAETVEALDRAAEHTGCFAAEEHGIPMGLVADLHEQARRLAALDGPAVGFTVARAGTDDDEAGAWDPAPEDWPAVPGLRTVLASYHDAALDAAGVVLRGVALALGLTAGFFDARMRRPRTLLRLGEPEPVPGTATPGLLTLLAPDDGPGLEIRGADGVWARAAAPPGTVVVVVGPMLARWTNDRYVAGWHRVRCPEGAVRRDVRLVVQPDPHVVLACLPSCTGPSRPCRYEPLTVAEYLAGTVPAPSS